jgi:hypothetical protein
MPRKTFRRVRRGVKPLPSEVDVMVSMRLDGHSLAEIVARVGYGRDLVRRALTARGVCGTVSSLTGAYVSGS